MEVKGEKALLRYMSKIYSILFWSLHHKFYIKIHNDGSNQLLLRAYLFYANT